MGVINRPQNHLSSCSCCVCVAFLFTVTIDSFTTILDTIELHIIKAKAWIALQMSQEGSRLHSYVVKLFQEETMFGIKRVIAGKKKKTLKLCDVDENGSVLLLPSTRHALPLIGSLGNRVILCLIMCVFEDFIIMKNCLFASFNYTIEIYNFRMTPNLILSSFFVRWWNYGNFMSP